MIEKNNDYQVYTKYGKGNIYKNFLDFSFTDLDGQKYTVLDLLNKSFLNETEIKKLRNSFNKLIESENKVDELLSMQLDILSKKVARLEYEIKQIKGEEE